MNILYYVPTLNRSAGGVFQYSYALLSILSKSDHYYYVYSGEDIDIENLVNGSPNMHLLSLKDYSEPFKIRFARRLATKANHILICIGIKYRFTVRYKIFPIDYLVMKFSIDIIHCPYQTLQKSSWGTPAITTMHDVQELHFPEFFTSEERASRAVNFKYAIDRADAVIVSYEHVKNDIIKYFKKEDQKIYVCLIDMQNLWLNKFNKEDVLSMQEYNLPDRFILYPAATWQHKNHIKLFEALKILKAEKGLIVNLVCPSHKTEFYPVIENKLEELNLEKQVKFIDAISDQELYSLYLEADAVVIPTLYEAGSFPLMESILLGIPVICSNVTSLPETIGDHDYTFDPGDSKDIADKIFKILYNEYYRNNNIKNIKYQSARLLKNDTLNKIHRIYDDISKNWHA
jgi:glycosyltransferase involved in cell wall biosynthesis